MSGVKKYFCTDCGAILVENTSDPKVLTLVCTSCGSKHEANAADTSIMLESENDTSSTYARYLKLSAHLPTVVKVKKDCPNCKLNYMTQNLIGDMDVVYTCKCGVRIS